MKRLLAGFLITAALSSTALATDLVNQDNKAYTVTIVEGSYTQTKKIGANGTIYGLCTSGPCTFKIKGSEATADKDGRVIISNGQIKTS